MTTHEALLPLPALKFGADEAFYRGACSCGWIQKGFGSAREARRATKAHVHDSSNNKNRKAIAEAEATCTATPEQVIEAAWQVLAHYDLAAVAWERATTVIGVYSGSSTAAVRYILSGDLANIIQADRVSMRNQS